MTLLAVFRQNGNYVCIWVELTGAEMVFGSKLTRVTQLFQKLLRRPPSKAGQATLER